MRKVTRQNSSQTKESQRPLWGHTAYPEMSATKVIEDMMDAMVAQESPVSR